MIKVYKFQNTSALEHHLNGGICGGKMQQTYDVAGKTLQFGAPSATVSFTAGTGPNGALFFKEVAAQCVAANAAIVALILDGHIGFIQASKTAGISITGGTARTAFGFSTSSNSVGVVYAGGGTTPPFVSQIYHTGDAHVLVAQES